jgi:hypothetical protein
MFQRLCEVSVGIALTDTERSLEAKIFMVTHQKVYVYMMTELILWLSTRLKNPLFIQCVRWQAPSTHLQQQ